MWLILDIWRQALHLFYGIYLLHSADKSWETGSNLPGNSIPCWQCVGQMEEIEKKNILQCEILQNMANLRDLIAATSLIIFPKLDWNLQFLACVTLKFDWWPWKTIGHPFYSTSSFVHHFKAIGELSIQAKLEIFLSLVTLKFDEWPPKSIGNLCYTTSSFSASFQSHGWIQTRVTVRKCSIRVKISNFFVPYDLEIWRMILETVRHIFQATSSF